MLKTLSDGYKVIRSHAVVEDTNSSFGTADTLCFLNPFPNQPTSIDAMNVRSVLH